MDFRTPVHIETSDYKIHHQNKIMMLGSCFTQHIGNLLKDNKFDINLNPFGVIYNPISIGQSVQMLIDKKQFAEDDLFEHKGLFSSLYHHGSFSDTDKKFCLSKINKSMNEASKDIYETDILFVTFGTSYVYELIKTGEIVSNCHKLPTSSFGRYRVSVESIVQHWTELLGRLEEINPRLRVLFTVSPIRHLRDGAHDNQLSKATLLLAIEQLCKENEQASYFSSYEIVLDELRDYRFFDEDMVHPNRVAIKYIWERFSNTYFDHKTKDIMTEWNKLSSALQHRPLNGMTEEYKQFLKQTLLRVYEFRNKYTYICLEEEIEDLMTRIGG